MTWTPVSTKLGTFRVTTCSPWRSAVAAMRPSLSSSEAPRPGCSRPGATRPSRSGSWPRTACALVVEQSIALGDRCGGLAFLARIQPSVAR